MNKEKYKNYEINVYKLKNELSLEQYLEHFESLGKDIQFKQIIKRDNVEYLYLTYKNTYSDKDIAWFYEWKNFFDIKESLRSGSTTGHGIILIKTDNDNLFAIVFGRAFTLIKDYIIHQFGMNMATILFDGKSIDSISSKYFSLNKNKSITSYYGESTFEFAENEAVDLLKADITNDEPNKKVELEELLSFVQRKATIGMDNLKLTIHKKVIKFEDIINCCKLLSRISKYDSRFPFPQMSLVKGTLIDKLDEELLKNIMKEDSRINISVPFYSKDASDEYVFLNNINDIQLKIGRETSDLIQNLDSYEIKQFLVKNSDEIKSIRKVQIIVDGESDLLIKWIDEQIEYKDKSYAILNGKWYQFNKAYVDNINSKVKIIEKGCIIYIDNNDDYSFGQEEQTKFYNDFFKEIQESYGNGQAYKEYIYNFYLKKKYNYELFDRVIFKGGIEICDLYGDKKLIHCKIGNTSQLEECIRQSLYGTRFYYQNTNDAKNVSNKDGIKLGEASEALVIFLSNSSNIKNFSISNCKSLRLKQTFIDWVNMCNQIKFTPKIIISRFNKKPPA